jgi:hypothetical protein
VHPGALVQPDRTGPVLRLDVQPDDAPATALELGEGSPQEYQPDAPAPPLSLIHI